ncbi:major head protein [Arthrobacter phage Piccoletto]|uniref:Major capsid protein n=3 Tax=Jawnskivirus TaxID=3425003 RepID=A0A222ZK02_9CAUD|nr:major head protein [Arthrobacter phage Jawnski]YP_009609949.1 major head protein [Arthrobacter phage Beans]YP_009612387.1 major head protein [Arthrobacter phage Piccoletto]UVK62260.1 major capsid protein [Arthrobacter phage NathanVaag]ALY09338.1 major capsid protein [Arthrobacter phage Jawnski]ASR80639.1 major capsid protein [Arthrobacter phage Piccoletto]ASR84689.1 major capsid protein [Arthrobacter phage Beans]
MTLTYPAPAPVVDPNKPQLTVNALLKAPKVIAKRIITPSQNFLSDELFRPDTNDSGVVIYNSAKKSDIYPKRGDVQEIEPGGEFPMVDVDEEGAEMALSKKHGAGYIVTDEAARRNQLSVITKGNLKVRNALLRQDAYRCLAAFRGAVPTVNATGDWTEPRNWRVDLLRNQAGVRNLGLGYNPNAVIISPTTATDLLLLAELDNLLPRENKALNPVYNPTLSGLLNFNWIVNEFASDDEAIILETKMTGLNSVEKPYEVEVVREGNRKRELVLADKWSVPVIDEPESALIITGIRGE